MSAQPIVRLVLRPFLDGSCRPPFGRPLRPVVLLLLALAAGALTGCATPGDAAPPTSAVVAPPAVDVRLLAFNDFHGHLETGDNTLTLVDPRTPGRTLRVAAGGAATLAGLIRAERAAAPMSLVISAGDLIGASPLASSLFRDEPTLEVMNAIGLSINAVGNHEFDHGLPELRRQVLGGCASASSPSASVPVSATLAPFQGQSCADPARPYGGARFDEGPGRGFLAANVVDAQGEPVLPPYVVHRFAGVPVGFIGVVTRSTPTLVQPSGVAGLRFLDEAETVNRHAAELKARGVHALVAVIHEGGTIRGDWNDPACPGARGPIFEIERRLSPDVAVVFSGHTHQGYACRIGGPSGRIVMQAASFGRGLSRVDLRLDRASGRIDLAASRAVNLPVVSPANPPEVLAVYPAPQPDARVQALVDAAVRRAEPLARRPIGWLAGPATRQPGARSAGDHAAGRLIADAQLAATRAPERGGAQLALMNPGGVRADFPCSPAPCELRFGDAFTIQPFGNSLVVMTLTGAQLRLLLEQQATGVNAERPRMLQPSEGFRYRWSAGAPPGERASALELDGRPVGPDDRIRVVVNSFLADGGDGFSVLVDGRERVGGPLDLVALGDYLQRANAPIVPPAEPRILRP